MAIPEDEVGNIVKQFNQYNTHIQYTIEKEDEEQSVNFLDTKLYRIDSKRYLHWHKKQTASDKLIH